MRPSSASKANHSNGSRRCLAKLRRLQRQSLLSMWISVRREKWLRWVVRWVIRWENEIS